MKVVVFTAVYGPDIDRLRSPLVANPDVQYRCYTDQASLQVPGWEMVVRPTPANPVRQARLAKILSHRTEPAADVTIWHDSAYQLLLDPLDLIERYALLGNGSIWALRHPDRNTAKEEGAEIVRRGLADPTDVVNQIASHHPDYRQETLTSTGLLIRDHTTSTEYFNQVWWNQFLTGGHTRDQMSVDYAAWCVGVPICYLPGHYRSNGFANWAGRRR